MTIALTAGNDIVDTYIRQEYAINGVDQMNGSTFMNLIGETVDGGAGIDTLTADWSAADAIARGYFTLSVDSIGTLTMTSASGSSHFTNFEKFVFKPSGGPEVTVALGTAAADSVTGTEVGDQFLFGLGGSDTINGGAGNDKVVGGTEKDNLTGGTGSDTFVFGQSDSAKKFKKADVITDFKRADGDKIDLSAIDANMKTAGVVDHFKFIKAAAFHHKAGELHYIKDTVHKMTIIEADWNGDAKADFSIQLTGAMKLAAADFILTPLV